MVKFDIMNTSGYVNRVASLSSRMRVLPLLFIVVGAIVMHLYLYYVRLKESVDVSILFGGVFLQSIGFLLLIFPLLFYPKKAVNKEFFMMCVLALSFSITLIDLTRFPIPFHTDAKSEYLAASVTKDLWNPGLASQLIPSGGPYAIKGTLGLYDFIGCLSVTIFPAIVSNVIGMDVTNLFTFFYPVIVALMPLSFFIVIRRFLGDSVITYLSAALIPPYLAFSEGYIQAYRSAVAVFMLYVLVYCMTMKNRKSGLLAGLLGFGVVTAHLTVGYFGVMLFAFFLLSGIPRRLLERLKLQWRSERVVNPFFFAGFVMMVLAWAWYANVFIFTEHVHRILFYLTEGLREMSSTPEAGYIAGIGGEPILTAWFDLEFLLIGVGALIGLYMVLKGRLSKAESTWIICGCGGIGYILATAFLNTRSNFGPFVEPPRAIIYLLPFAASFLALSLLKMRRRYLKFLVILFIALMLPMNMMLPSHEKSLIFHASSALTPERLAIYGTSFALEEAYVTGANWIRQQIGTDEFIRVDSVGYAQMIYGLYPPGRMDISSIVELIPGTAIRYLVAHDIYLKYGVWYLISGNRTMASMIYDPNSLLQNTVIDFVYNNNAMSLFCSG